MEKALLIKKLYKKSINIIKELLTLTIKTEKKSTQPEYQLKIQKIIMKIEISL